MFSDMRNVVLQNKKAVYSENLSILEIFLEQHLWSNVHIALYASY